MRKPSASDVVERFWSKVWFQGAFPHDFKRHWVFTSNPNGPNKRTHRKHARFWFAGRSHRAARFAFATWSRWYITKDLKLRVPKLNWTQLKNYRLLNHCGNKACVQPGHHQLIKKR